MRDWEKAVLGILTSLEERVDAWKYRLRARLGKGNPIIILPYQGFGTAKKLYLKGRVLEDKKIAVSGKKDRFWDNLANMYKRFQSDEIPHARILARFQGFEKLLRADEEGFFEVEFEPAHPLPEDRLWHTIDLELIAPQRQDQPPARAQGQVLVPPSDAEFGVISDIDDTVLHTQTANPLRMARNLFLGNAYTRLPFPGVAAFYQSLMRGSRGDSHNPIFYVSSSPWNIYDLLTEFFRLQEIPFGPLLFLRDWGLTREELLPTSHHRHKLETISRILGLFNDLSFILIGDSGQEDPEIYTQVIRDHPGRVLAIYIRNVTRQPQRIAAIQSQSEEAAAMGIPLLLARDTLAMAHHAAENKWISPDTLAAFNDF